MPHLVVNEPLSNGLRRVRCESCGFDESNLSRKGAVLLVEMHASGRVVGTND